MTKQSEKVQLFIDDIIAVFEKHELQIVCEGYDNLQVWRLEENATLEHLTEAQDRT
jgi:hypothetical protein